MSNRVILIGWRKRWNESLLRFLKRRVRSPVDIEDLAQETYLRLLRARDLTDVENPQGYLLRVAAHVVGEWHHSQPTAQFIDMSEAGEMAGTNNPEFELEAEVSKELIEKTLQRLPLVTQAALLMKFRENCTLKDIAERLELTERQARRHLTRGYEELRLAMER